MPFSFVQRSSPHSPRPTGTVTTPGAKNLEPFPELFPSERLALSDAVGRDINGVAIDGSGLTFGGTFDPTSHVVASTPGGSSWRRWRRRAERALRCSGWRLASPGAET
jgi:hypothetical protein